MSQRQDDPGLGCHSQKPSIMRSRKNISHSTSEAQLFPWLSISEPLEQRQLSLQRSSPSARHRGNSCSAFSCLFESDPRELRYFGQYILLRLKCVLLCGRRPGYSWVLSRCSESNSPSSSAVSPLLCPIQKRAIKAKVQTSDIAAQADKMVMILLIGVFFGPKIIFGHLRRQN